VKPECRFCERCVVTSADYCCAFATSDFMVLSLVLTDANLSHPHLGVNRVSDKQKPPAEKAATPTQSRALCKFHLTPKGKTAIVIAIAVFTSSGVVGLECTWLLFGSAPRRRPCVTRVWNQKVSPRRLAITIHLHCATPCHRGVGYSFRQIVLHLHCPLF
jgi:hypothetical protein